MKIWQIIPINIPPIEAVALDEVHQEPDRYHGYGKRHDTADGKKISQDMETLSHKLEDMEKNICRAI